MNDKELKKLLKKGWVERRVEVIENRPPRDIYEITDKGWNAIREVYEGNFNLEKKIFSEFYILLMELDWLNKILTVYAKTNEA